MPLDVVCAKGHKFKTTLRELLAAKKKSHAFCPNCNGHLLTDEKIKEEVELRGFMFVRVTSKKTGARSYRYITIKCPEHGEHETLLSNFRSKPSSGCARCGYDRCGKPTS